MELECSKLEFHLKKKNYLQGTRVPSGKKKISQELEFPKLEFHVFFLFNPHQMNPRVNQVGETQFWVGTKLKFQNSPTH